MLSFTLSRHFSSDHHTSKIDSDGVQRRNLDFKLEIDTDGDGTPDVTTNRSLTAEIQNKTKPVSLNLKRDNLSRPMAYT